MNFINNKKADFNFFLFLGAIVMLVLAISYSNYTNNKSEEKVIFFDLFQDNIENIPNSIKNEYLENYFYYKEIVNTIDSNSLILFNDMIDNCDDKYMDLCIVDSLDLKEYMDNMYDIKTEILKDSSLFYIEKNQEINIIP